MYGMDSEWECTCWACWIRGFVVLSSCSAVTDDDDMRRRNYIKSIISPLAARRGHLLELFGLVVQLRELIEIRGIRKFAQIWKFTL